MWLVLPLKGITAAKLAFVFIAVDFVFVDASTVHETEFVFALICVAIWPDFESLRISDDLEFLEPWPDF
jgi:hypothetical protein